MTTKPEDLIRELRDVEQYVRYGAVTTAVANPVCLRAADLIEELLAENRRLRKAAQRQRSCTCSCGECKNTAIRALEDKPSPSPYDPAQIRKLSKKP